MCATLQPPSDSPANKSKSPPVVRHHFLVWDMYITFVIYNDSDSLSMVDCRDYLLENWGWGGGKKDYGVIKNKSVPFLFLGSTIWLVKSLDFVHQPLKETQVHDHFCKPFRENDLYRTVRLCRIFG